MKTVILYLPLEAGRRPRESSRATEGHREPLTPPPGSQGSDGDPQIGREGKGQERLPLNPQVHTPPPHWGPAP